MIKDETILEIKNLTYCYGSERDALKGINLSIKRGEKIAVLGANGAGKSTFFLCLNQVLTQSAGELLLYGKPVDKKSRKDLRKTVGIVFQEADHQIIAPTVKREVSFGPMNLKLPIKEVEERTKKALADMNLTAFENRAPHTLSGGEKKRLTIADILAMESEIFLFDEPATGLDPVNQEGLEAVLKKLSESGKTLLVSTHDVDFAWRFAERILIFKEGELVLDGPSEEIFLREQCLDQAGLRLPAMLQVGKTLKERGILSSQAPYPKTPEELERLLTPTV